MNIPNYILEALDKRAKAAEQWNHNDLIISEFIDKNGIAAETHDYHGGVEALINPRASNMRIRNAILEKEE